MESIFSSEITIPLFEVMLLLVLSTLAFLFGRLKLAILINYCFTVYWGYILNFNIFTDHGVLLPNTFTYIYLGAGFLIILLAILGFWTQHD
jgi:hypothetical protein